MATITSFKDHFRKDLNLGLPIVGSRLGQMLTGLADNIMVGQLGAAPLAAASFAHGIFMVVMVFGIGVSLAITPLTASDHGKEEMKQMPAYLSNGLFLNILSGLALLLLIASILPFMDQMGQPPKVADLAAPYLMILGGSLLPMMVHMIFRQFAEGLSLTRVAMYITLIGNAINIFLNYLLIYGNWGFPAFGLNGAGYATFIARILMATGMILYLTQPAIAQKFNVKVAFRHFSKRVMNKLFKMGAPIGLQMTFEVSAFSGAAILIGWLGTKPLAAHQVALILMATTFMMASGFAQAGTVRVGNQFGKRNIPELRKAGLSVFLLVGAFMFCCSLLIFFTRHWLPTFFIDDPTVVVIAAEILVIAALFQISDGLQVVGMSNLRGLEDVWGPTLIAFFAYWICGIPAGYYLAFHAGMGAIGVWTGLFLGLTIAAVALNWRFFQTVRQQDRTFPLG